MGRRYETVNGPSVLGGDYRTPICDPEARQAPGQAVSFHLTCADSDVR